MTTVKDTVTTEWLTSLWRDLKLVDADLHDGHIEDAKGRLADLRDEVKKVITQNG